MTDEDMVGRVASFDEPAGLGVIVVGDHTYPFHCIEIADGSRTIAEGTLVRFVAVPRLGRHEAGRVRPV